jgi:predicted secreted protein
VPPSIRFVSLLIASVAALSTIVADGDRRGLATWRFDVLTDLTSHGGRSREKTGVQGSARPGGLAVAGTPFSATHPIDESGVLNLGRELLGLGLLDGVAILELRLPPGPTSELTLELPSNPSTGARWRLDTPGWVALFEPVLVSESGLPGAVGREIHRLRALPGSGPLRLVYGRPWLPDEPPSRRLTIEADALPDAIDLAVPRESVPTVPRRGHSTRLIQGTEGERVDPPDDGIARGDGGKSAPVAEVTALPARFDWRDRGIVPPVKDQQFCGSCWAFAATAASESAVALTTGQGPPDFSEQYLVSCDDHAHGCGGGLGASAIDLYVSRLPMTQAEAGPVLEKELPYQSRADACPDPLPHEETLLRWVPLVDAGPEVPSESSIKQALYEHGPLVVSFCVGTYFSSYRKGVFKTDERKVCKQAANHEVLLIGWDDAHRSWIARNSWGEAWGEAGYFEIRRGISNFPSAPAYAIYDPASPVPPRLRNESVATPEAIPAGEIGVPGRVLKQSIGSQAPADGPTFPGDEEAFRSPTNMVWYSIRPEQDGLLAVDTIESNYDTVVGLWRWDVELPPELIAWNDDLAGGGGMRPSYLQTEVLHSQDYLIGVSSFDPKVRARLALHVSLDPSRGGAVIDDRESPPIEYTGTWESVDVGLALQGDVRKGTKGAVAAVRFTGNEIGVVYPEMVGGGKLKVYVDGKRVERLKQSAKNVAEQRQRIIYRVTGLPSGEHRLELRQSGSAPVYLDGVLLGDASLPASIAPR